MKEKLLAFFLSAAIVTANMGYAGPSVLSATNTSTAGVSTESLRAQSGNEQISQAYGEGSNAAKTAISGDNGTAVTPDDGNLKDPSVDTESPAVGTVLNVGNNQYTVTTKGSKVAFSGTTVKGTLKIPATITVDDTTYKVTSIAAGACQNNTDITVLILEGNVTSIKKNAFSGCTALKSVLLNSGVITIGIQAFRDCVSLTTITIPKSVTKISTRAFRGCIKLKTVSIGSGVKTIGSGAFRECLLLSMVTIPKSVTAINTNTFYGCAALSTVTLRSGITKIGSGAFANCTALKSVTIPKTVTTIGTNAFSGDKKLSTVTLGTGVQYIGKKAFCNCSNLTVIIIKSKVLATVRANAFLGISASANIQVKPGKVTAYTKLMSKKGQDKTVTISKIS